MNHWTETDFQNWLYGLRDEDRHSTECPECRREIERLRQERRQITAEPEVPQEFLTAQRRRIYQRVESPGRNRNAIAWRWALSLAMLLLMVVGITIQQLYRSPAPISDEQLFSDLSSIEQTAEPKAIQPIHNLFEQ